MRTLSARPKPWTGGAELGSLGTPPFVHERLKHIEFLHFFATCSLIIKPLVILSNYLGSLRQLAYMRKRCKEQYPKKLLVTSVWVSAAFYSSSVLMIWIWTTLGTELLGQIQAKLKVAAVSTCLYTCSKIWNIQVDVVTRAVMSDTMTRMLQRCKMHTWLFCYVWVFLQVAVVELVSASSLPCFN